MLRDMIISFLVIYKIETIQIKAFNIIESCVIITAFYTV